MHEWNFSNPMPISWEKKNMKEYYFSYCNALSVREIVKRVLDELIQSNYNLAKAIT